MIVNKEKYIEAVKLRERGLSYREIESKLGIPRSTLSGWLRHVELSDKQKEILKKSWRNGLVNARSLASKSNHEAKLRRVEQISQFASEYMRDIDLDIRMLEIFLAGLYLGDGFKTNGRLGFGNSDPKLVVLFLQLIRKIYPVSESKIKVQLFLRADQNVLDEEKYWSETLDITRERFHKTQIDRRMKSSTRSGYHGVCAIVYPDTLLQMRILAIGQEMIKYVGNLKNLGS